MLIPYLSAPPRKKMMSVVFIFAFFFSIISSNAFAEVKIEQGKFILEVKDKLINIQAENANFKEILGELERKTGIKVEIFEGVGDKKVSLKIESLPIHDVSTILRMMSLRNSAVVYDKQIESMVVYVLPIGYDLSEILIDKDRTILFSIGNEKKDDISHLDNPATFRLMQELKKKKQAVLENLDMFPLPKFKDITKEISFTKEDVDEILKSKAKTLDVPPELKRNIASIAVVEDESPYNVGDWFLMPDETATYLLKINLEEAKSISVKFELNQINEKAFILAYIMENNEVVKLLGPIQFTPRHDSSLVVPSLMSDTIYIEIRNLPAKLMNRSEQDPFLIKDIQYYTPNLYKYLNTESLDGLYQSEKAIAENINRGIENLNLQNETVPEEIIEEAATCSYTEKRIC